MNIANVSLGGWLSMADGANGKNCFPADKREILVIDTDEPTEDDFATIISPYIHMHIHVHKYNASTKTFVKCIGVYEVDSLKDFRKTATVVTKRIDKYHQVYSTTAGASSEYTIGKFLSFGTTSELEAYTETIKAGTYVYVEDSDNYYKVKQDGNGSEVAHEIALGNPYELEDGYSAQGNYVIADKYKDVIFYCTDSEGEHKGKIYLNGLPYGGEDLKVGDGLTYNANKELTLTPASGGKLGGIIALQEDKKDGNNFNVSVQKTATPGAAYVHIPNASEESNGLMTKEQVEALENKSDVGHSHNASDIVDFEAYVTSARDSAEKALASENAAKQSETNAAASEASAASHDESSRSNAAITTDVVGMVGVPEFIPNHRFLVNEYFRVENQMYVVISSDGYISEEFVFDETKLKETTIYDEVSERINKKEFEKVYVKLKKKVQVEDGVYEDQVVTGEDVAVSIHHEGGTLYTEMTYNPLSEQFEASVLIGIDYYINIGSIEGYSSAPEIHKTAALWQRTFEYTFVEDVIEQQNVTVNISYSGATKADNIYVTIGGGEELPYALEDGTKCSFGVPHGASYTVRFEALADYIQLNSVTYIADGPHRTINAFYVSESFGYRILKKNGEYIPISSANPADVDNYVGMLISTSKLYDKEHGRFVIPYNAPTGLEKKYLSTNTDVGLGKFTSAALALNDTNGEYNTTKIAEFAAAHGYTSTMVSYARAQKYTINEVEYQCMVPAYAQLAEICNATNYTFISKAFREIFGIAFPNVRSGYWWSSTEYSASNGVYTINGSFSNNNKNYSLSVLPLLAY